MTGGYYSNQLYNDYQKLMEKKETLAAKLAQQAQQHQADYQYILRMEAQLTENEKTIQALTQQAETLKKEVERLNQIQGQDSTNSGLPTGHTPLHKNKHVPNSRKKSGKKKGGQAGHKKHTLPKFQEDELTDVAIHDVQQCPNCQEELNQIASGRTKDEFDYQVVLIKKRHVFPVYQCPKCQKKTQVPIPPRLKEENQYGPHVQAMALSLMNEGNVSLQKTQQMIRGLTFEEIQPSEGYLAKLQQRAAKGLETFTEDLRRQLLTQSWVHWDDTVVMVNQQRVCLRFYGDETIALYKAHRRKNKAGVLDDQILSLLNEKTTVIHDHNTINYGEEFSYAHAECNAHLLRDLQKCSENTGHQWSQDLASLIQTTHQRRKQLIEEGTPAFSETDSFGFFLKLEQALVLGEEENKKEGAIYYAAAEKALLKRLMTYRLPYFSWVVNFDFPFTNNVSERSLRGVKSKMKVAGQFQNIATAKHYAAIRSYCESCRRNQINPVTALEQLVKGEPWTVAEILNEETKK